MTAWMEDPRLNAEVEAHPYPLLFATVSGAHLYGFPSPDSDFDLRGSHILPVDECLALGDPTETLSLSHIRDGAEVDLVTHDVRKFFTLLLRNNGYVLEQLYSPLVVRTTPEHAELKEIARGCITRGCLRHYKGFARNQWALFTREDPPRIKPLLYVYRVLLTGIHLMRTGEVNANLLECNADLRLPYLEELVARKTGGPEKGTLTEADLSFHRDEVARLQTVLEEAAAGSHLPQDPTSRAALNDLLLHLRREHAGEVHDGQARSALPRVTSTPSRQEHDDLLDLADVAGKRLIETRLVTLREENTAAVLERMSRFAANPKWLIYLPPAMSPCETSERPGLLEHPAEAFAHFRNEGIERVVCEEKHRGSRAVLIVCRDEEAAVRRFGVTGEGIGLCATRTGGRFFDDPKLERELLGRVRDAIGNAGLWERLGTGWVCLDAELMPWSAKAQDLIRNQVAAVGAAARASLPKALARLAEAGARGLDTVALLARYRERYALAGRYTDAYRRFCWPVRSLGDLRLAPFHLLASEGAVHADKNHLWHMETLAEVSRADPSLIVATRHRVVDLADPQSEAAATAWWEEMADGGGEGMVVKPLAFVARGRHGLVQPALKCRGPESLRIIYGPEYTLSENLARLRSRGLSAKRSLALHEFALGLEALERFVRREPLRRVQEGVFGVLALESEPVDPRL